jgi:hypothetical protein
MAGQDPKIICHDVVVLFADMLWSGLAGHFFLLGRQDSVFLEPPSSISQNCVWLTHLKI